MEKINFGYALKTNFGVNMWCNTLKDAVEKEKELFKDNKDLIDTLGMEANIYQEIYYDKSLNGPFFSYQVWRNLFLKPNEGEYIPVAPDVDTAWHIVQEEYPDEMRYLLYKNYMKKECSDLDTFWDWWDSLDDDDRIYVVNHPEGDLY